MRGIADREVRARTDAWRRHVGELRVHEARGGDMSRIPRRRAGIPGVTIRRSTAADWDRVGAFLDRFRETIRHSSCHPDNPTPSIEIPTDPEDRCVTLIAEWSDPDGHSGLPRIVGLLSWRALERRRPDQADAVLVVASGWAARGVGSALVAAAARGARRRRLKAFVIPVIPRNGALRAAAREAGLSERRITSRARDEVEILLAAPRACASVPRNDEA
jgi:GNAT superfamily N-acetyltransferase